jgi:hypothetical protein
LDFQRLKLVSMQRFLNSHEFGSDVAVIFLRYNNRISTFNVCTTIEENLIWFSPKSCEARQSLMSLSSSLVDFEGRKPLSPVFVMADGRWQNSAMISCLSLTIQKSDYTFQKSPGTILTYFMYYCKNEYL